MSNKENLLLRIKAVQALDLFGAEHCITRKASTSIRIVASGGITPVGSSVSTIRLTPVTFAATSRICPISRRWPRRFAVWMKSSISRIRRGETGEAYPADASGRDMPVRPVRFPVVRPVRFSAAGRFRNPCLAGLRSDIVAEKESGTPRYRESSALFRHCPPRVNAAPSPSTSIPLLRCGRS